MENKEIQPVDTQKPEQKPNLLFAVLASIGLALVGCVLYGVLYYVGYIAWIVSYITVLISAWGYKHFNKKMDWKGYLTVTIASVAGLIITMFIALTLYVSKQFNTSFGTAFNELFALIGDRADIRSAVVRDGILTAVFTVLGILSYLFYEKKAEKLNLKKKQENGAAVEEKKTETSETNAVKEVEKKEAEEVKTEKVEEKKLTAVPEEIKATKPKTTQRKTQNKTAEQKPLVVKPVVSNKPKTTTKTTKTTTSKTSTAKSTASKKTTDKKGE